MVCIMVWKLYYTFTTMHIYHCFYPFLEIDALLVHYYTRLGYSACRSEDHMARFLTMTHLNYVPDDESSLFHISTQYIGGTTFTKKSWCVWMRENSIVPHIPGKPHKIQDGCFLCVYIIPGIGSFMFCPFHILLEWNQLDKVFNGFG